MLKIHTGIYIYIYAELSGKGVVCPFFRCPKNNFRAVILRRFSRRKTAAFCVRAACERRTN